jgi:hypothetical protein
LSFFLWWLESKAGFTYKPHQIERPKTAMNQTNWTLQQGSKPMNEILCGMRKENPCSSNQVEAEIQTVKKNFLHDTRRRQEIPAATDENYEPKRRTGAQDKISRKQNGLAA